MMISPSTDQHLFLQGVIMLTDYLRTYGEIVYLIVSKERRIAID